MKQENAAILVGVIIAPHGINGLVSVECLSDNPNRFAPGARLYTDRGQTLTVEKQQAHKGRLLIGFSQVEDRNQAEKLRGVRLFVDPAQVEDLPPGVYYHFQIIGLQVWQQGRLWGEVSDILDNAANDVYVVTRPEGGQLLLPALKSVVKTIDLEKGVMEVEVPEGLV
ncbi:MAG: ribosome maturation factor RimM [Firmicutes bacterium]|nr:ribosome maturation factor RimM [Bacillota bacterium]